MQTDQPGFRMDSLNTFFGKIHPQASLAENEKYLQEIYKKFKMEISGGTGSREQLLCFMKKLDVSLVSLLDSDHFEVGFSVLTNLLKLDALLNNPNEFPVKKFYRLIKTILNSSNLLCIQPLLASFSNDYCDIRFYILKFVLSTKSLSPLNIFTIISLIDPESLSKSSELKCFLAEKGSKNFEKLFKVRVLRSLYNRSWLLLIKSLAQPKNSYLRSGLIRKVLLKLNENILKNLTQPLLLSEFFSSTFSMGGVYSILSLGGLFFLIKNCNVECDSFFQKLYEVLTPKLFKNHRIFKQFSKLIFRLLKSKYLTNSASASIVKQIMFLSLGFTPNYFKWAIPIAYNMIKERIHLRRLLQSESIGGDFSDNYDPKLGIENSNAEKTFLWEIPSLECHYYRSLGRSFNLFSERLIRPCFDLEKCLLLSIDSPIRELQNELNHKWTKKPHLNLAIRVNPF